MIETFLFYYLFLTLFKFFLRSTPAPPALPAAMIFANYSRTSLFKHCTDSNAAMAPSNGGFQYNVEIKHSRHNSQHHPHNDDNVKRTKLNGTCKSQTCMSNFHVAYCKWLCLIYCKALANERGVSCLTCEIHSWKLAGKKLITKICKINYVCL